jgi:DNA replication and repair protein RecF
MYLQHLTLYNFKNYGEAEFDFEPGANAFVGMNGSGKTNILDSIYYLCLCKSFFHSTDSLNIRHNESFFSIAGKFDLEGSNEDIFVGMKAGQKKIVKRNLKEYSRLSEHIGLLPIVMVAPADQELISGSGEERRKLMDGMICQFDYAYLDNLVNYNRILQQRNAFLKQSYKSNSTDLSLIQVWDEQLSTYGTRIFEARKEFIDRFVPVFKRYYTYLTDGNELVSLNYDSKLHGNSFADLLASSLSRDRSLQYTSTGIHRDDLELLLNNYSVKKIGSQGQQKSFVLAVKLAQFELMKIAKGLKPILLLDDIFDKLDLNRITRLMELVSEDTFGQIFITDTNESHIRSVFETINTPLNVFSCSAELNKK